MALESPGNQEDPLICKAIICSTTLPGVDKEPPGDHVQSYENERNAPESEEERCVRIEDRNFPKNGEAAPHQAKGDEEGIGSPETQTGTRLTAPQELFS